MMNTTLRDLRTTLARHPSELARGAARHVALQPYADGEAVLAALALDSALSPPERDALVRALVIEAQRSRHGIWTALLILAFQPALRRLRARAGGDGIDDVDATLMHCLLESVATLRVGSGPLVLALHQAVARRFFRQVRVGRRLGHEVPVDERLPDIPWHREPDAFVKCAAREVLRACEGIPGATSAVLERAGLTGIEESDSDRMAGGEWRRSRRRRALARLRETLGVSPAHSATHPEAHSTPSSRQLGRCRR